MFRERAIERESTSRRERAMQREGTKRTERANSS